MSRFRKRRAGEEADGCTAAARALSATHGVRYGHGGGCPPAAQPGERSPAAEPPGPAAEPPGPAATAGLCWQEQQVCGCPGAAAWQRQRLPGSPRPPSHVLFTRAAARRLRGAACHQARPAGLAARDREGMARSSTLICPAGGKRQQSHSPAGLRGGHAEPQPCTGLEGNSSALRESDRRRHLHSPPLW